MVVSPEWNLPRGGSSIRRVPFIELARGGTDGAKEQAALALRNLAHDNAANQAAIASAGGIAPLIELARGGTDGAKKAAARALSNLAHNAAN